MYRNVLGVVLGAGALISGVLFASGMPIFATLVAIGAGLTFSLAIGKATAADRERRTLQQVEAYKRREEKEREEVRTARETSAGLSDMPSRAENIPPGGWEKGKK